MPADTLNRYIAQQKLHKSDQNDALHVHDMQENSDLAGKHFHYNMPHYNSVIKGNSLNSGAHKESIYV